MRNILGVFAAFLFDLAANHLGRLRILQERLNIDDHHRQVLSRGQWRGGRRRWRLGGLRRRRGRRWRLRHGAARETAQEWRQQRREAKREQQHQNFVPKLTLKIWVLSKPSFRIG